MEFDRRIFGQFPDDIFDLEEWNDLDTYWMYADGIKVGCTAFKANVDYDESPKPGCLSIVTTGILPEFRGKGLGTKMKAWQIEYARNHHFESLTTNMRKSNHQIIELNERLGFKIRHTDEAYYSSPDEPAIVMDLDLDR